MPNRSYNNGNTDSRFKFTGKELDQELDINLYYFGARYYDPALARWTSVDPLADKYSDMSPYNYCGNEPILKVDKDGEAWSLAVAGAGAILGAASGAIYEICHQAVLSADPKRKFSWKEVGKSTTTGAVKGAFIGGVMGLISGDPTALLTESSIGLTTTLVVSGSAIQGTAQGIIDYNDKEDKKEDTTRKKGENKDVDKSESKSSKNDTANKRNENGNQQNNSKRKKNNKKQ